MKKLITLISAILMLCGSIGMSSLKEAPKDTVAPKCQIAQSADCTKEDNNCSDKSEKANNKEKNYDNLPDKTEEKASAEKAETNNANTQETPSCASKSPECDTSAPACPASSCPAPSCDEKGNTSCEKVNNTTSIINEIINRFSKSSKTESSPQETAAQSEQVSTDENMAVYEIVNRERAKNGLSALSYRYDLQTAANKRAEEIVTSFSHTRPNGSSCFTVLSEYGITYRAVGENIAAGQRTPEAVMNGWMNSQGHRANILNSNFTGIAVGVKTIGNTKYWVQIFIK